MAGHRSRLLRLSWLLLALLLAPLPATAETRIALVISNQSYTQAGARLTNTHRDGDLVKSALEKVGFQVFTWLDPSNAPVWVSGLQVRTTRSVYTFGDADGTAVECVPTSGEQIIGFYGRTGSYIDQLGCLFSGRAR
jgi:Jacalin-like lectin domain